MIRTGYLRWEIEVADGRSARDPRAREAVFRARPSFRRVLVARQDPHAAAERFAAGVVPYNEVLKARDRRVPEVELAIADVGPHVFRYSEEDFQRTPRFWMEKLQREAAVFAHEVVRAASQYPQLVVANPVLRAGYARLVEQETLRVIEGRSQPQPTNESEPMRVEARGTESGVPELVAAELVRDVVTPDEFQEFRFQDRITIWHDDRVYRIPRRSHALIQVWNARTFKGEAQLCIVFQDPGMPPSDELVMKYLLVRHDPETLWRIGIRFTAPPGKFDGIRPRAPTR